MKTTDYTGYPVNHTPWVMQVPVVSTAHMRKSDDIILHAEDLGNGPVMADLLPGWLLLIEDFEDNFGGYSDAFLHLLETFHNLGFHYLRLDPSGEILDDLPRFEW